MLGFGKAKKLEDLKVDDLLKEKTKQDIASQKHMGAIRRAQEEYDRRRDIASEPGVSQAEKEVAAYRMSQALKRKNRAETDLQRVITRMTVLDATIDIIRSKADLEKRGIWKTINGMNETALENQLDAVAFAWKESDNKLQTIVDMFEKAPADVAFDRGADFDVAMNDIEQAASRKEGAAS